MSTPLSRISPLEGISKPAIMRRVVVLPQPDGPRMVINSPRLTSKLKSSTTVVPSNSLHTCRNEMSVSFPSIQLPPKRRISTAKKDNRQMVNTGSI